MVQRLSELLRYLDGYGNLFVLLLTEQEKTSMMINKKRHSYHRLLLEYLISTVLSATCNCGGLSVYHSREKRRADHG